MATLFVRTTGNDGTGDGSIDKPFLTIGAATLAANQNDIIDVGIGTFTQTTSVAFFDSLHIKGQGYGVTTIVGTVAGDMFAVGNPIERLIISDCTLKLQSGDSIINVSDYGGDTIWLYRVAFLLCADAFAVTNSVADINIDVINCVIRGLSTTQTGIAFYSTQPNVINAVNCIFTGLALVVDDTNNARAFVSNYNIYYNNFRELRVGDYGDQDLRDTNPLFVSYDSNNLNLLSTSPAKDAGLDLTAGYGTPTRQLPPELNASFYGKNPDIGIFELIFPGSSLPVKVSDFHFILQTMINEFDTLTSEELQAKYGRFVDYASPLQLRQRFGALLGVYRPSDMDGDTFRAFIKELLTQFFMVAPAGGSLERATELLYDTLPQREDYFRERRFPLSRELKLKSQFIVPPPIADGWTPLTSAGSLTFNAVFGTADDDAWTASFSNGSNAIYHWDGDVWAVHTNLLYQGNPVPLNAYRIYGDAPDNIYIMGDHTVNVPAVGLRTVLIKWDGVSWTCPTTNLPAFRILTGLAKNGSTWYLTAVDGIYSSTNLTTWTIIAATSGLQFNDIITVGGVTIAVGDSGRIRSSANGFTTNLTADVQNIDTIWASGINDIYYGSTGGGFLKHSTDLFATPPVLQTVGGTAGKQYKSISGTSPSNVQCAVFNSNNFSEKIIYLSGTNTWSVDTTVPAYSDGFAESLWINPSTGYGIVVCSASSIYHNRKQFGWIQREPNAPGSLGNIYRMLAYSETEVYFAASGGYFGTYNGTTTSWQVITPNFGQINTIWSPDQGNTIWAGINGGGGTDSLFVSTNSGVSWNLHSVQPNAAIALIDIFGVSASEFWLSYADGKLYRTQNSGTSFTLMNTFATYAVNRIWGLTANNLYAVGTKGSTYRWNGTTWTQTIIGNPTKDLYAVWGFSTSDIFVGGDAELYHTADFSSFTAQTIPANSIIYDVLGADQANVWAAYRDTSVGSFKVLLRSNTPNTWIEDPDFYVHSFFSNTSFSRTLSLLSDDLLGIAGPNQRFWFNRFAAASSPTETLTVRLTSGPYQLRRRWFRALDTDLELATNATSIIYSDSTVVDEGTLTEDFITPVIKASTDLTLRRKVEETVLTGNLVFTFDSDEVTGTGTSFTTELQRHDRIRPEDIGPFYVVDEVVDDTNLILRRAYAGSDYFGTADRLRPIKVFGEVVTNSVTIIDIHSQGRLGDSAFLNTRATKGHGFHLVVDDPTDSLASIFDNTERSLLLNELFRRMKPVHKLGYLSFRADYPRGIVIGQDPTLDPPFAIPIRMSATVTIGTTNVTIHASAALLATAAISASARVGLFGASVMSANADVVADGNTVKLGASAVTATATTTADANIVYSGEASVTGTASTTADADVGP